MITFADHQFKKRTIADTKIVVWQERDRFSIALLDSRSEKTLVEWLDADAHEAIEDGFLDAGEAVLGNLGRYARQGGKLHRSAWARYVERAS